MVVALASRKLQNRQVAFYGSETNAQAVRNHMDADTRVVLVVSDGDAPVSSQQLAHFKQRSVHNRDAGLRHGVETLDERHVFVFSNKRPRGKKTKMVKVWQIDTDRGAWAARADLLAFGEAMPGAFKFVDFDTVGAAGMLRSDDAHVEEEED